VRWTKLQNHVVVVVALCSNENHSSNGLSDVIRARCYCDRAHLAATEHSNGCGDGIDLLLVRYLCENMAPFTSLNKNRLSTESSPQDPPSACIGMPEGTHARTCTNGHEMRAKGGPSGAESY
jgi:hypothetical protein